MSLERRAGAPRLIEWTGERCVPWIPDVQILYQDLHRYLWAANLLTGKRVLELGSGEGFGASILADTAAAVVGIDIDERTTEHARLNWAAPRLSFLTGDALDLSRFDDGSFDAVVAFEIIEQLSEPQRMLAEIARVLSADGVLIISSLDPRISSEASSQNSTSHQHQLTSEDFSALLERAFSNVAVWGQRAITGSHLDALDGPAGTASTIQTEFFIERAGEEWRIAGAPAGLYLVALASNALLPAMPAASTLSDCGLEMLRAKERDATEVANKLIAQYEEALARERSVLGNKNDERREHETELRRRETELRRRDAGLAEREAEREAELRQRGVELADRDEYISHRQRELAAVRSRLREAETNLADLRRDLDEAQRFARRVEASVTWQAFQGIRGRLFASIGERSVSARVLRGLLRFGGRLMNRGRTSPASSAEGELPGPRPEPIRLPTFEHPTVSLIVPVYARADLTHRCLETIRDNTDQVAFEVILVDDEADAATKAVVDEVKGARILRNEQNEGYLRSVNRGASIAYGEWLVLCNNDIEVTPGWLSTMLACGEAKADVGVVAPKLVSPDGRLSEAGAILWSDGTGMNFGRGDDPTRFQYEYSREIDYGSAAALLVRVELWRAAGGFDERYAPMYYEDADLCLEARRRGWHVVYEPSSMVVHVEGATAGTDLQSGYKRYQEINRLKFLKKWQALLESEHLRPGSQNIAGAATRHRGPPVLVVDFRVPMWDRDAGSLRMFEIIRSLMRLGYGVIFLPANSARREPYTRQLQRLGVEVIDTPGDLLEQLTEIGPKLTAAILSRPHPASQWLDSVREFAPSAVVIYDTVDLHWVRESLRFALNKPEPSKNNGVVSAQGPKAAALFELELAMVRASDVTVVVTPEEQAQILHHVPEARLTIIPTVHDIAEYVPPTARRDGLLFLGGFEHTPNIDAVIYLVREVMPHVWRRLPNASLTIVGASAPREVEELASARVEVRGWVPELQPLLDSARAMVAPVRFGAGIKGKITQGLASGLPVVTTPVGALGLKGEDNRNMLIGADAEALAERIVRVIEDDALWESLSRAGQELVATTCSLETLDARLGEVLGTEREALGARA